MFSIKTCFGLLGVGALALPNPTFANCWGEFDRPGETQFGFVLVFEIPEDIHERPRFRGVVGPGDQLEFNIVSVELPKQDADRLKGAPPTALAVVADVEILESGLRSINVIAVLSSIDEVQDAKQKSDANFPGSCGSAFSDHWKAT